MPNFSSLAGVEVARQIRSAVPNLSFLAGLEVARLIRFG